MNGHYLDCTDPECPGCLPSDEAVAAMPIGQAFKEARRRGLSGGAIDSKAAILADADDYRARSAEARRVGP